LNWSVAFSKCNVDSRAKEFEHKNKERIMIDVQKGGVCQNDSSLSLKLLHCVAGIRRCASLLLQISHSRGENEGRTSLDEKIELY
jgi:hypothetical protein